MRIALVYDRINKWGGAERVLLALHEIWPEAPLYTAVYNPKTASWANVFKIKTSWLQKLPLAKSHHQFLSLFTPNAFSKFNFNEFDIVLSITSAEAKYIKTSGKTRHVCYLLTPTRYLWSQKKLYESQGFKGKILSLTAPFSRMKDFEASQQVDNFVAISSYIQKQIKKYYKKDSQVIFPPVSLSKAELDCNASFKTQKPFYLVVSRLEKYKRIDLAIEACNQLNKNLVVIGSGTAEKSLKKLAGKTIKFIKNLTDEELASYYKECQALLFCQIEDFGIVSVETQSFGKPVIAFGRGGVLDTVIDKKTGLFFEQQTVESLVAAIKKFETLEFSPEVCRKQARKFSKDSFKSQIKSYIEKLVQN